MKHILFPTDLSDNSWTALVYLLKFHIQKECAFYLMNAAANNATHSSAKVEEEFLKLKKFAEDADANANHTFYLLKSSEKLEDAISYVVRKYKIDMVAMAADCAVAKSKRPSETAVLELINRVRSCPLFLIPEAFDYDDLKNIGFIADVDRPYLQKDLNPLKKLAGSAKINILYFTMNKKLSEIQKYHKHLLEKLLTEYDCDFHIFTERQINSAEINSLIEIFDIQLLVANNAEFQWGKEVLEKPLIHEIASCPKAPFLIMHDSINQ